jgi:hypothetical protein
VWRLVKSSNKERLLWGDIRLQVGESVDQQLSNELTQELRVGGSGRSLARSVKRSLDLSGVDKEEHAGKEESLKLESSLVVGIGKDEKDVLKDGDEELLEEGTGSVGVGSGNVVDELNAHVQSSGLDLTIVVLGGPETGINNELELAVVELQQGGEAGQVNGTEKLEELDTVLGVLGEVLVDHLKSAFKNVLHDDGNLVLHESLELGDDGGHNVEDLSIAGIGNVTVVVDQYGVQKRRNNAVGNHLQVVRLLDIGVDQLQDLLLDGTETTDTGHLRSDRTVLSNTLRDHLGDGTVHAEHVHVDTSDLRVEVVADRGTSGNVGLHNVSNDLDGFGVLQNSRVLSGLGDDRIPSLVGEQHQVMDQPLLGALLSLRVDHVTTCLVESVDLLGRKVAGDALHVTHDLLNKGLRLAGLEGNKVPPALLGNLNEGITSHVLDTCFVLDIISVNFREYTELTLVGLVHELEKLVDNSLQEFPMSLQESRILSNNVHNVRCNNSLVVLTALHLGQS